MKPRKDWFKVFLCSNQKACVLLSVGKRCSSAVVPHRNLEVHDGRQNPHGFIMSNFHPVMPNKAVYSMNRYGS